MTTNRTSPATGSSASRLGDVVDTLHTHAGPRPRLSPSPAAVPAVIWGDLSMLRCFAGTVVSTLVVSSDPSCPAFYSRLCRGRKLVADPVCAPDQTARDLVHFARHFVDRPVLFYGNDSTLLVVSRHRDRLAEHYRLLMPEPRLVEDLVSKTRFAELCVRLDLPAPRTLIVRGDVTAPDLLQRISLPCVFKPDFRAGWFQSAAVLSQGGQPRKVLRADNPEQFHTVFDAVRASTDEFILQEYVEGGDDCIYSFHAWCNAASEPLGWFVGRKIRTYPRDSGISTFVELVHEPRIVQLGQEILASLRFVGPVKIDFKLDRKRGQFFLLEMNPRFNLWHHLGAACGVNLPLIAWRNLVGEPPPVPADYRTDIRWVSFVADVRAFRDYHRHGDLSWFGWLLSYRGRKVYDVFAWNDPYPAAISAWQYIRAFCRRLPQRFLRVLRRHLGHPRQPRSPDSGPPGDRRDARA